MITDTFLFIYFEIKVQPNSCCHFHATCSEKCGLEETLSVPSVKQPFSVCY